MERLIVGITGATGTIYGVRIMELLRAHGGVEIHLVMSRAAKLTLKMEHDSEIDYINSLAHEVHEPGNVGASISSGSFHSKGMMVAPCSIKTMSNIAIGNTGDLISRAADVVLKEHRRLVIVPRETPLHAGHCKLLYEAAMNGAIIAPPMPAFYNEPETLDDIINHTTGRLMDLFGLNSDLVKRWEGANNAAKNQ